MSDRSPGILDLAGDRPEPKVQPYTWIGLVVVVIILFALIIAIFIGLVLLAFVAEIPIEGWSVMSYRLAWCYQIIRSGNADLWLPHRLLIGALSPVTPRVTDGFLLVSMLPELSGIAAVFCLARLHGGKCWRDVIAWRSWELGKNARVFVLLLIAALAFNFGLGWMAGSFAPEGPQAPASTDLPYVLLDAVESIVFAACAEELVMRGWLYTALRAKLAAWPTIIITALLFAGAHLTVSVATLLSTVPLGLAAGYLRERTGSVRAAITFHMLHNLVAVSVLLLNSLA